MLSALRFALAAGSAFLLAQPVLSQSDSRTRDSLEVAGRPIVQAVQRSIIQLSDGRKSSVSIESAVHWHEWTEKFTPRTWSAREQSTGQWTVSLVGRTKRTDQTASWSYNAATGAVNALDTLAATLSYRKIPALDCAIADEELAASIADTSRRRKVSVTRLIILPLPVPERIKPYNLEATFAVDVDGAFEVVEWTRPNDAAYAARIAKSLLGYTFRPGTDPAGVPVCGRTTVTARSAPRR